MKKKILVIDAYGLIYKTYYAFYNNPLMTNTGKNISCVYGFFNSLYLLIQKLQPDLIISASDSIGPTFRHKMYPEYKANREKTPEDLHAQIPLIEDALISMNVQSIRCNGFEADDVIATITEKFDRTTHDMYIFSSDKDLLQLVGNGVYIVHSEKDGVKILDTDAVTEAWRVDASQILDLLSLTGDTADNVKGVTGIGIKTAQKILNNYPTVDDCYKNLDKDTILTESIKNKLRVGRNNFNNAKKLITLNNAVPVSFDFSDQSYDFNALAHVLESYQIPSIAKKFTKLEAADNKSAAAETPMDKPQSAQKKPKSAMKPAENLTPLQKLAAKHTAFNFGTELKYLKSSQDLTDVLTSNKDKKKCAVYLMPELSDTNNIAVFSFCFDTTVYVLNFYELNDGLELLDSDLLPCIKILKDFFSKAACTFIFDNAKQNLQLLKHRSIIDSDESIDFFDLGIAAWVLQSTLSNYTIDDLARFFQIELPELDKLTKKAKTYADVDKNIFDAYLCKVTQLIMMLHKMFLTSILENNFEDIYNNIELKLVPILCQMEDNGIFVSVDELNKFSESIASEIAVNEQAIYKAAGHEFNIASPKQLQKVLFEEKKLQPIKKIKTGFSTDDATLEALIDEDKIIVPILNYRKLTKLQLTYAVALPKLVDEQGFIHTTFLQTGTATGRLSSRDPNLQNIPIRDELGRKIRHAFHAQKDEVLLSADYSQIELVVLAHLSGDKALCDAFNAGTDIHAQTASLIFDTAIEKVEPRMRRIAKVINFGVIYGMSAFRLSNELKIPRKVASEFIDNYFKHYAGVKKFLEKVKHNAEQTGYVETITGRRRYIPEINSNNKVVQAAAMRMAINTPVQGSASDIVKKAMIDVSEKIRAEKIPAKLLLQVHDELIFSCKKSESERLKTTVKNSLEHVVKLSVPLRVSIEVGNSWGDFH